MKNNQDEKPLKLTEASYVSISLLVIILIGALRVESISSKANGNEKDIDKMQKEIDVLRRIDNRLARIEGKLGLKGDE